MRFRGGGWSSSTQFCGFGSLGWACGAEGCQPCCAAGLHRDRGRSGWERAQPKRFQGLSGIDENDNWKNAVISAVVCPGRADVGCEIEMAGGTGRIERDLWLEKSGEEMQKQAAGPSCHPSDRGKQRGNVRAIGWAGLTASSQRPTSPRISAGASSPANQMLDPSAQTRRWQQKLQTRRRTFFCLRLNCYLQSTADYRTSHCFQLLLPLRMVPHAFRMQPMSNEWLVQGRRPLDASGSSVPSKP